jgi:hypothetical protein
LNIAGEEGRKIAEKNIREELMKEAKAVLENKSVIKVFKAKNGKLTRIKVEFEQKTIKEVVFGKHTFNFRGKFVYKYLLLPKLDKLLKIANYEDDLPNLKREQKPLVSHYYYFSTTLLRFKVLLGVEKLKNTEGKIYYRLYSFTKARNR